MTGNGRGIGTTRVASGSRDRVAQVSRQLSRSNFRVPRYKLDSSIIRLVPAERVHRSKIPVTYVGRKVTSIERILTACSSVSVMFETF
jgi:hypothetical protein